MKRVLIGVTGSVAAIRLPRLVEALRPEGHLVRVAATGPSFYFFEETEIGPPGPDDLEDFGLGERKTIYRDEDEWRGPRYQAGDSVLHIKLRDWAEILVLAPLDANTLAKLALGLSDNLLTCVFRAWDFSRPVIMAPAMNTRMWDSPATRRHLTMILSDHASTGFDGTDAETWSLGELPNQFATLMPRIVLVAPQSKRLACGDVGVGAMAEVVAIADEVRRWSLADENSQGATSRSGE